MDESNRQVSEFQAEATGRQGTLAGESGKRKWENKMKTLLIVGIVAMASAAWAADAEYMTYEKFIEQVEAGNVKSVSLDDSSLICGMMKVGDVESEFQSYGDVGSANDPLLAQLLKEHGVVVSIRDTKSCSSSSPYFDGVMCIFLLLPIVFLILMIVIISKLNRVLANQKVIHKHLRGDDVVV